MWEHTHSQTLILTSSQMFLTVLEPQNQPVPPGNVSSGTRHSGLTCHSVFSCKASVRRRNADGQTAYDVAVRSGCNNMVSLLAAQTGLDLLGKLGKPKLNLDVF